MAAAEATAYRAGCACVYAAVVRGDAGGAARRRGPAGVRAVDPAPEVYRLDRTVFTPPLPEQRDVVRPPADTGPSAAPTESERPAPVISAPAPSASVGESSEPAPVVTIPSPESSKPVPTESAPPSVTTSPDATVAEPSSSPSPS